MKRKTISRIGLLVVFIFVSILLWAQAQTTEKKKDTHQTGQVKTETKETGKEEKEKESDSRFWFTIIVALAVGFIGREGVRAIFKYFKNKNRIFRLSPSLREKKIPLHYYEKEYEEDSKVIDGKGGQAKKR